MIKVVADGGSWQRWWIMTMDCGLWWHLIVVVDPDRGGSWSWTILFNKTAWYPICLLTYSTITDNISSINLLSIMLQTVSSNQCCIYSYCVDVLHYAWHLLHFCPSWEKDPSHVALSEVPMFFPLKWLSAEDVRFIDWLIDQQPGQNAYCLLPVHRHYPQPSCIIEEVCWGLTISRAFSSSGHLATETIYNLLTTTLSSWL